MCTCSLAGPERQPGSLSRLKRLISPKLGQLTSGEEGKGEVERIKVCVGGGVLKMKRSTPPEHQESPHHPYLPEKRSSLTFSSGSL